MEVPAMDVVDEEHWDCNAIFTATSPTALPVATTLLTTLIQSRLSSKFLKGLRWSKKVYCTNNFMETVKGIKPEELDSFLRLVDVGVLFPNGSLLLLSEREGDFALRCFWDRPNLLPQKRRTDVSPIGLIPARVCGQNISSTSNCGTSDVVWYVNFSFLRDIGNRFGIKRALEQSFQLQSTEVEEHLLATVQLFAGEADYPARSRQEALKRIFLPRTTKDESPGGGACDILDMRGTGHHFARSDLETVCIEVDREAEKVAFRE
mmetsp:Transcript_20512/g.31281  ORF Transcript_20512/g.31281 Transcript_20512/m.31281 type:complete len:263 (+) Transcript_20512:2-790(+)